MRYLIAATILSGGCDLVIGLGGAPTPCDAVSFATAQPVDVAPAEDFSISWDGSLVVYANNGLPVEQILPDGPPSPIELVYRFVGLSLAPEADALFFTALIEPLTLVGAVRDHAGAWQLTRAVPRGTYAGTPSADAEAYGPRRVLVRLRDSAPDVQEYEDDAGTWVAVGNIHAVDGRDAPNLTPNGLTMVYATDAGVFSAKRDSTSAWFGEPAMILPGAHTSPQLLGRCKQLYVIDNNQMVRRYDQ